ncbi:MAG: PKD domain-containing protein, partial [Bacteroidota bacterium]
NWVTTNYGDEYRGEIIVDGSGNCYIASITSSSNFPVSAGAHQTSFGGNYDGVIFSLNANLSLLNWSTYFGGPAYDVAFGIRKDAGGNIFVSGAAGNGFFTSTGYTPSYQGGTADGCLAKFSSNGSALLASTYFGTSGKDEAFFVDINPDGDVYIYGQNAGIITPTAGIYANPNSRQFIAKFIPGLNTLVYKTVIGSGSTWSFDFAPSAFMVDICDRVYIAGHSYVSGYLSGCPVTMSTGGFSSSGGVYLAVLEPAGVGLMFGSYIQGADHVDGGTSRFDPNGIVYHGVCSCSWYSVDFPTTAGAYDNTNSTSNCDMGVFKINFDVSFVQSSFQTDTIDSLCVPATIHFTNNSQNAMSFFWDFGDGTTSTDIHPVHTWTSAGTYEVLLVAIDSSSCNISDSTLYTIYLYNCGANVNDTTICYGDTAMIIASGIAAQSYSWSNGLPPTAGPHYVSPLVTTDYFVSITDSIGNVFIDTATVTVIPLPVVDLGNDTVLCPGTAITLNAGNAGSTFLWQDASVNQTYTPTTNGIYTVTVTDSTGCEEADSILVEFSFFTFDTTVTHILCYGGNNGAIDLTTNGLDPMSYEWSNSTYSQDISGIQAGTYTVTVTDDANCEFIINVPVVEPPDLIPNPSSANVSCYLYGDGSIALSPSGGVAPYTFAWSTGDSSSGISGLEPGVYTFTVTDANLCSESANISITQPTALNTEIIATHNLCYGDQNGTANLLVTGGTPPFTFLWSSGSVNEDLVHMSAGFYTVIITDDNACTITDSVTIFGVDSPLVSVLTPNELLCFGDMDGMISSVSSGGTPPYTYEWNNGQLTPNISNLPAGMYTLTLTDDNNCQLISSTGIIEPDKLHASLPENFFMCLNPEETITVSATGGTYPYYFSWSNGSQGQSIDVSPTVETTYNVTVTDNNNCVAVTSVTVYIHPPLVIEAFASEDTVCPGESVLLNASFYGGSGPPYQMFVDGQLTSLPATVYPANTQTFSIGIIDQCNTEASDDYTLYLYPSPPLSFNSNILQGCEPLEVYFNEHGNCEGCSYTWNFDDEYHSNYSNAHNPVYTFQDAGVYDITCIVTDLNGCVNTHIIENMITVFPTPDAAFFADPEIAGIIKPQISFINHTTGAVEYHWTFGDGDSSQHVNPVHWFPAVGIYNVELVAISDKDCRDTVYMPVEIRDEFTFYAPSAFSPDFDGINDIFFVYGSGIDNDNFILIIYDRWGEKIFESTDLYKGWDGRAKNRSIVQTGTYTWLCIFKDFRTIEHTETGMVTVIR